MAYLGFWRKKKVRSHKKLIQLKKILYANICVIRLCTNDVYFAKKSE